MYFLCILIYFLNPYQTDVPSRLDSTFDLKRLLDENTNETQFKFTTTRLSIFCSQKGSFFLLNVNVLAKS